MQEKTKLKNKWFSKLSPERKRKYKKNQAKKATLRRRYLTRQGRCIASSLCERETVGKSSQCLYHWLQTIYRRNRSRAKQPIGYTEKDLIALWDEQKGRCALTQVELIPGETASLDHIIPLSRGGTNTKKNLQFVHLSVNTFKSNMMDEELKDVINQIGPALVEWAGK